MTVQKILDVMPSDMAGMEYSTRGLIAGYRVCVFARFVVEPN